MKRLIILLFIIFGTFSFAGQLTGEDRDMLFKGEIYVSNKKEMFISLFEDDERDSFNFLIHVLKVGNKYKIAYTPLQEVSSYDKQKYPILKYRPSKTNIMGIEPTTYVVDHSYGMTTKNGKLIHREYYQILTESQMLSLLKSKNAKRVDPKTEKDTRQFLNFRP